jgi:hypothetical protein
MANYAKDITAAIARSGAASVMPCPVEFPDTGEWCVGFGNPNPEPEYAVTVASRDDAFRLCEIVMAILFNCTAPSPEALSRREST